MQQFKNVALHPVDVGGRVLASGEVAELSPSAVAVRDGVSAGTLLALATFQEPPAGSDVPDDDEDSGAPRGARKGSEKTATDREES